LAASVALGACGSTDDSDREASIGTMSEGLTPSQPFERPDIYDFTSAQRTTLANAILAFITQPVLDEHENGHDWHHPGVGELFFIRHHDYLMQLERYLQNNGLSAFVPLPTWKPADPIPTQFRVADPLVTQATMNATPNMPLPPEFAESELCKFETASELAQQIEGWHDDVHSTVSGAMGSVDTAPGAPIFWLWHGFLDDLYHERDWRCAVLPALITVII
jgi:hypothetical protein